MKKVYYLIVIVLISSLVFAGCSLLSNIGQAPATDQSGITYLTKNGILDPNLVGLWHFDGNAFDSSGNLNHGSLMGDASWTSGKFGNALSLGGTEDYVSVEDSTSLDITTELTIEAWVQTGVYISGSTPTRMMQIVDKGEHAYLSAYMLMISGGNLYGRVNKEVATACIYPYPNDGEWHHVAYTVKSGEQKLYIDGSNVVSKTSSITTITTNDQPLFIGRGVGRPQYCWNGAIDEVRIWNVALPQEQLGKVYEWTGFFRPVDDFPTYNAVKAGRAIPVKFSLNGDQGLDIFEDGYPISVEINCDDSTVLETAIIEGTDTADGSSLNYDADADQYIYVWKTEKEWTGCRQLIVKLIDGTSHMANFTFK